MVFFIMAENLITPRVAYQIYRRINLLRDSLIFLRNRLQSQKNLTKLESNLLKRSNNLPKYSYQQLRQLSQAELDKLSTKVETLRTTLDIYQSRGKRLINRQKLTEAYENILHLARTIGKISKGKHAARPQRRPRYNPRIHQQHSRALRNQVLMERGSSASQQPHSLRIQIPIQVIRKTSRPEVEYITKPVAEKSRIEAAGTILQILSRLLIALSLKKVLPSLKAKKGKKAVRSEIERALEELNSNSTLTRFVAKIKVKDKSQKRTKTKEKSKATISIESQKSSGSGQVIYKTILDGKGNIIGIEIIGKIEKPVETARNVVNRAPVEMIPILTEASVEAVRNNPKATFEVLDFVSKALSRNAEIAKISLAPDQTLMPSHAMQTIVGEVVHTLISKPDSPIDLAVSAKERMDIALKVLQKHHEVALPILLKENVYTPSARNLILKLAQNRAIQNHILNSSRAEPESRLVSALSTSEVGREVIIKTAQGLINRAKAKPTSITLTSQIVSAITLNNPTKFSARNLTFETAKELCKVVSKTKQCYELAGVKQLRKRIKTTGKKPINYYSRRYKPVAKAKKVLPRPKISQLKKAVADLSKTAKKSNLLLPDKLVKHLQAGLAGLNIPVTPQAAPATNLPLPEKSAQATSMERILAALEAETSKNEVSAPNSGIASSVSNTREKIDGMRIVMDKIKGMVWNPNPVVAATELNNLLKKLKEANGSILEVAAAIENKDIKAFIPLFNADLIRRIEKERKIKASPPPAEAESDANEVKQPISAAA